MFSAQVALRAVWHVVGALLMRAMGVTGRFGTPKDGRCREPGSKNIKEPLCQAVSIHFQYAFADRIIEEKQEMAKSYRIKSSLALWGKVNYRRSWYGNWSVNFYPFFLQSGRMPFLTKKIHARVRGEMVIKWQQVCRRFLNSRDPSRSFYIMIYPLVIEYRYWKSPFIVDIPIKDGDFQQLC